MRQREAPAPCGWHFFHAFYPFFDQKHLSAKIMSGHIIRKGTVSAKKTSSLLYVTVHILISNDVKGGNCYV